MVKIRELINLEKTLLEMDKLVGVPLGMKIELNKHLKNVGDITSAYFKLLYDFHDKVGDEDKLSNYQMKLWDEELETDVSDVEAFVDKWKT